MSVSYVSMTTEEAIPKYKVKYESYVKHLYAEYVFYTLLYTNKKSFHKIE
jgi:hypothetical protein